MTNEEIIMLATLLAKHANSTTEKECSFYGAKMDKALCKDTLSTLFRYPELGYEGRDKLMELSNSIK